MTTVFLRTIILIACVGLSSAVSGAESNVVNLWECSVNDGKTMKDVEAANSKWVKFANATVKGGNIQSYIMTPLVGLSATFKYADAYPSLSAWAILSEIDNEAIKAIEAELNEAATCSANTLHRSTPS